MFLFLFNRCCAAAWDKKMRDTVELMTEGYIHKGCAASASVSSFFFVYFIKFCVIFSSFYS
jgi:hypothetical protein